MQGRYLQAITIILYNWDLLDFLSCSLFWARMVHLVLCWNTQMQMGQWLHTQVYLLMSSKRQYNNNFSVNNDTGSKFHFGSIFRPSIPNYDVLQETCETIDPSLLKPAQKLNWSISPEISEYTLIAKKKIERCSVILSVLILHSLLLNMIGFSGSSKTQIYRCSLFLTLGRIFQSLSISHLMHSFRMLFSLHIISELSCSHTSFIT